MHELVKKIYIFFNITNICQLLTSVSKPRLNMFKASLTHILVKPEALALLKHYQEGLKRNMGIS